MYTTNPHPKAMALASAACITAALLLGVSALFAGPAHAGESKVASSASVAQKTAARSVLGSIERGRYLVQITGCNDCHTPGYAETGGKLPASDWLSGNSVGYKGPWGLSYASNLRLTLQSLTEDQWLIFARAERLPPMPWFALRDMNDDDLRAMYRFIRSLGPKGTRTPSPAAPGMPSTTPFILFEPQMERVTASR